MVLITTPGKVSENIHLIGNLVMPSFLIRGDKKALIDTGMTISGPNILADLKVLLGERPPLNYILLTHSHFDHAGGTPYLKRYIPGAIVAASRSSEKVFFNPRAVELIRNLSAEAQKSAAIKEDVSFTDIHVDLVLREGDEIDLEEATVKVYSVPGHTRCSLAFFVLPDRALFCGEACGVPDLKGEIIPEFLSSYDDYMESLEKMSRLEPLVIGLAHGGVLSGEDAVDYLPRSIKATEMFKERIKSYLQRYSDIEKVVEVIAEEDYSKGTIMQAKRPYLINLSAKVNAVAGIQEERLKRQSEL